MTPEEAKKLIDEEYERAKKLDYVRDPLAFALYSVWKKADKERKNGKQRVETVSFLWV